MIDFISFYTKLDDPESFVERFESEPSFEEKIDSKTGYMNFYWKKNNLIVKVFSDRRILTIKGSLPNFFKGYNHLNYRKSEIDKTIDLISVYLGIDSNRFKLTTMEFGVNIITNKDPKYYFKSFIKYRNNFFAQSKTRKRVKKGNGIQCDANDYTIKIYNKTWVANVITKTSKRVPDNILRFELRYTSSKLKKLLNVTYLSDLTRIAAYNELFKEFFKVFRGIEKISDYDFSTFTNKQLGYFCLATSENHIQFLNLLAERDPKLRLHELKNKEKFFSYIEKYSTTTLWGEIGKKSTMKWKRLMNT
jgi:predicted nucleic acid binding AN1-type Zn finger protein